MEGVQLKERTTEITFADAHEYNPGLWMKLSLDVPADMFFDLMERDDEELEDLSDDASDDEKKAYQKARRQQSREMREVYTNFGDVALVEWNLLDRRGDPVSADGKGMMSQPFPFIKIVIAEWTEAIQVGADDPLVEESDSSAPSLVVLGQTGA